MRVLKSKKVLLLADLPSKGLYGALRVGCLCLGLAANLFALPIPSARALTVGEATLVSDISPVARNNYTISELISVGESVFFAVHIVNWEDGGSQSRHLWKSDGTEAGTFQIAASFGNPYPTDLTNVNGRLFLSAMGNPGGRELQTLNAAQDTMVMVADINPDPVSGGVRSSSPGNLANVNGTLYFTAYTPDTGSELWKHNPATGAANMVKDITTGSGSSDYSKFTAVNDKLFFVIDDDTNGKELWVSDGSDAGTKMVQDINSTTGTSSNPDYLTSYQGRLFFTANDGVNGRELWSSNGESDGTSMLVNISPDTSLTVTCRSLSVVGDTLFFAANDGTTGMELWKTDGTTENTVPVKDVQSGRDPSDPYSLMDVGGTLFFAADDGVYGIELWKSDGTEAGTERVTDINPGAESSYFGSLADVDRTLYFTVDVGGDRNYELWKTDGETTEMAANGWPDMGPEGLINADGTLFFLASHPDVGLGLWAVVPPAPPPPPPVADSTANLRSASTDLDPINTFTGELFSRKPKDLDLGGPMPLYFQRYYSSYLRRSFIVGDLGSNWRHNFDARLYWVGNTITYVTHDGRVTDFLQNLDTGDWNQLTNTDTPYQVYVELGEDVALYDPEDERIYTFDYTTSNIIIGKLVGIEDGHGNLHTVTYDLDTGHIETVSDGLDRTLTFFYNDDAIPKISVVYDGTRSISFQYTDPIDTEYLTLATDGLLGVSVYTYADTSAGIDHALITSTTQPRGNVPYRQTFFDASTGISGRVAIQTDADGNAFSFDYDGLETTLTDPLGNTRIDTNTATGEFSNRQDETGESFVMGSDATGRRNSITDRLGYTTTIDYDEPSGNIAAVTNADGTTSDFSYTERVFGNLTLYDLTTITHADGTTESLVYDAMGNATSHTDQIGNTATATYNTNGQPLTATNLAGGTTTNAYKTDGTLASRTDPAGNTTTFGYDDLKRLNLITFADGNAQAFTYNDLDQPVTSTDGNGNTTTRTYDANGNLVTVTDPSANTTTYTYDGNDRPLTTTDPLSNAASRSYHPLGKVATITDENSNTTTFNHDILGRYISTTDPLGHVWSQTYDAEAILASTTDPLGNTTTFVSDAMGRITETTSPMGNVSSASYDAMGRLVATTDPLGNTTTFGRDPRGLLSGITLPDGSTSASYTRNELGQIATVTDPNGNVWQRDYDTSGRLISSSDPLGNTVTTAYDNRNRLSQVTYPNSLGTLTMGYDDAGNPTQSAYSDGTTLNYTYDDNDRLTAANGITWSYDANGRIAGTNGIAIDRDPAGRITSMTLAPGKSVTYAYNANNRLAQVTDWTEGVSTFSYDAAGRLTAMTRPNGVNTTNIWDPDNRLTGITEGAISTITLARDAKGQIAAADRDVPLPASSEALPSSAYTYDAASQISGFTYDGLGRLTDDGDRTYAWDFASRLTSVTENETTTTFTYDALGRRLSRTVDDVTGGYVWNYALGLPSVSIEMQSGADLRYFVHTPEGELLYMIDAGTDARSFSHFDEMGNTIFVTGDDGSVIATYAYCPYGQPIASTGSLKSPFTWQGQYGVMDEGNGLYYVRARYYDANTGRFISRDSNKSVGPREVNPYQYAMANPLRFVDVNGMDPMSIGNVKRARESGDPDRKQGNPTIPIPTNQREANKLKEPNVDKEDMCEQILLRKDLLEKTKGSLYAHFNKIFAGEGAREVEIVTRYDINEDGYVESAVIQEYGKSGNTVRLKFNQNGVAYWGETFRNGSRIGGFYDPRLEPSEPSYLPPMCPKHKRKFSVDYESRAGCCGWHD